MIRDISIMIAGLAGDGVLFTGNVLGKILKRQGWEVNTYRDFPSNIRGEATNYTIRASLKKSYGRGDAIDILMAFDCDAILRHIRSLASDGVVLCEGEAAVSIAASDKKGRVFHKFPMRELAWKNFKSEIYKNAILLGGMCYILNLDFEVVERVITEIFLGKKGRDVVANNIQAIYMGCEQAKLIISNRERHKLIERPDVDRILISGDEAIAFGALAAGCRFFAAYPICPATEIWQWLVHYFPEFNGLVVQTEDEIAAINMALGAAYAGVRAMTSTSGPGASLMMEGFSLAGMAEIPVVVAHVQRAGPSTGLPTRPEQSDLNLWVFGSHGDFPRIVLSPGTIEECYEFTIAAFNLAEKYQCPVILLTEQNYGQNYFSVPKFDLSKVVIDRSKLLRQEELLSMKEYKRYELTPDGISARAIPSMRNGIHLVEGNEHDEKGYRDEDPHIREQMMEKRMRKLKSAGKDLIPPKLWGRSDADVGIIGFGSTLSPIREAIDHLAEKNVSAKYLQIRTLWPFHEKKVERFMESCAQVFVVENNFSGQLSALIQGRGIECTRVVNVNKYSGHTFRPVEISDAILKALKR
ncbi:MAG: 2-oxoacid:acceptor oxidoreductase subunit alpha [Candidatus Aminicenantes bacterium]|nr:2-oxoacid:acceptor oxidoreductase subunit alpha [Candidatus Aminicenantes bacterium]